MGLIKRGFCSTTVKADWASCKGYCTKNHLEDQANDAKTHAENKLNDAKDSANEAVDGATNSVNDAKDEAKKQAEVARCMGYEQKCSAEASVARGKCATVADHVEECFKKIPEKYDACLAEHNCEDVFGEDVTKSGAARCMIPLVVLLGL